MGMCVTWWNTDRAISAEGLNGVQIYISNIDHHRRVLRQCSGYAKHADLPLGPKSVLHYV